METAPGQFIACGRGRAGRGGDAMGGVLKGCFGVFQML
jgi:hypothetical protein